MVNRDYQSIVSLLCLGVVALLFGLGVYANADESKHKRQVAEGLAEPTLLGSGEMERLEQLIQQLGASDYRARHRAFLDVWKVMRADSRSVDELLEQAVTSSDPEVVVMVKWLQTLGQLAAEPDEVSSSLRNLALVRTGDLPTLLRLADQGNWESIQRLLEAIQPAERIRFTSDIDTTQPELAKLIDMAWKSDEALRIPDLVDLMWPTNQAVHARLLWRDLGLNELAEKKRNPAVPIAKQNAIEAIVELERLHREPEAIQLALDTRNFEKAYAVSLEMGRWESAFLAIQQKQTSGNSGIPRSSKQRFDGNGLPLPGASLAVQRSIASARNALLKGWAGKDEDFDEYASSIELPGAGKLEMSAGLIALTMVGRTEEAVDIVKENDKDQAYETLVTQGKIVEALSSIGWTDWTSGGVQKWLDAELQKKPTSVNQDVEITHRLVDVACLLNRIGETELGSQVDNAVLHWLSGAGGDDAQHQRNGERSLIEIVRDRWNVAAFVWNREHRRPYAIQQFEQLLRERIDDEHRNRILRQLDRPAPNRISWGNLAPRVLEWFDEKRASLGMSGDLKNESVLNADDSQHWSEALRDFEALAYGRRIASWPTDWNRTGLNELGNCLLVESGAEDRGLVSRQLAGIAIELKRYDLAEQWLRVAASAPFLSFVDKLQAEPLAQITIDAKEYEVSDDGARLEILAKSMMAGRKPWIAARIYGELFRHQPDRIDFALQQAAFLNSMGDMIEAQRVRQHALSFPFFPSNALLFAGLLETNELYDDAILLLRHALRSGDRDATNDWSSLFTLSSIEAKKRMQSLPSGKPLSSDSLPILQNYRYIQRRAILSRLDAFPTQSFELRSNLTVAESMWRATAAVAIAEGDFDGADEAIRLCHKALPEQIETPLELIPWGKEKFGWERVKPWFDLYADPMETHLQRWPNDTFIGNNLAWLYANLDQRLERAQELSRRVCHRLPDDDVYLDTMAEAEFRLGNFERAVEISAKCRQLAPLEQHHRNQIERFRRRPTAQITAP